MLGQKEQQNVYAFGAHLFWYSIFLTAAVFTHTEKGFFS
jgi:hypothetical protein